jgi:hypothetical protein
MIHPKIDMYALKSCILDDDESLLEDHTITRSARAWLGKQEGLVMGDILKRDMGTVHPYPDNPVNCDSGSTCVRSVPPFLLQYYGPDLFSSLTSSASFNVIRKALLKALEVMFCNFKENNEYDKTRHANEGQEMPRKPHPQVTDNLR